MMSANAGSALDHSRRVHIVLAPYTAFGHLIPLFELAKRLCPHHKCTIALSESLYLLAQARGTLNQIDGNGIEFLPLKDGHNYTQLDQYWDFLEIHKLNSAAVSKLIDSLPTRDGKSRTVNVSELTEALLEPVDVIITDIFIGETVAHSHRRGIPHYLFQTAAAACIPFYLLINDDTPVYPDTEDPNGFLKYLDGNTALDGRRETPQEMKSHFAPITKLFPLSAGIIVNSMRDLEERVVKRIAQDPVGQHLSLFFVGPLLTPDPSRVGLSAETELSVDIEEWLDDKIENSVVYASLGTVGQPSADTIMEIGRGLLLTQKPFILSLKDSNIEHLPQSLQDQLSNRDSGFADKPFLVLPWVPQRQVLNHSACAVFVSHCGWNSTLEGLCSGVPFTCWPMFGDNMLDAQLLVRHGVAEMMEGTGLKPARKVLGEELAETVRKVAGWDSGEISKYKRAAKEFNKKITEQPTFDPDRSQEQSDDFQRLLTLL
ncbi:hypothetical protein RvY_16276 [Ramazzottius varieornatus]|uniref:UDP-glucuronosyltransferase n=1 Tax=Ramazzottius varieornatus TaxID=947166 RepID=A0A1D1VXV6_RAMVA|nr:hypothetical protein RvY_16276 [Ramazzottius varieornatus]